MNIFGDLVANPLIRLIINKSDDAQKYDKFKKKEILFTFCCVAIRVFLIHPIRLALFACCHCTTSMTYKPFMLRQPKRPTNPEQRSKNEREREKCDNKQNEPNALHMQAIIYLYAFVSQNFVHTHTHIHTRPNILAHNYNLQCKQTIV